jgi:integration host factor subunit beta
VTKSDLVLLIAKQNPHLYQREIDAMVDLIIEEIVGGLADGKRVELRGFGSFYIKYREAHLGRNPRTGDPVEVEEKWVPAFKAGKELRDRLNDGG